MHPHHLFLYCEVTPLLKSHASLVSSNPSNPSSRLFFILQCKATNKGSSKGLQDVHSLTEQWAKDDHLCQGLSILAKWVYQVKNSAIRQSPCHVTVNSISSMVLTLISFFSPTTSLKHLKSLIFCVHLWPYVFSR